MRKTGWARINEKEEHFDLENICTEGRKIRETLQNCKVDLKRDVGV